MFTIKTAAREKSPYPERDPGLVLTELRHVRLLPRVRCLAPQTHHRLLGGLTAGGSFGRDLILLAGRGKESSGITITKPLQNVITK